MTHAIKNFLTRPEFSQCTVEIEEKTAWAGWVVSKRDADCKEAQRYLALLYQGEINGKSFERESFNIQVTYKNRLFKLERSEREENLTIEKAYNYMAKIFSHRLKN